MKVDDRIRNPYVQNFCKANLATTQVEFIGDGVTIYDSAKAILAHRIVKGKVDTVCFEGAPLTECVAVSNNVCRKAPDGLMYAFPHLESVGDRYQNARGFQNNFELYSSTDYPFAYLGLNDVSKVFGFRGNLTYDGLCAYMGLASNELLTRNAKAIERQIDRNAQDEMFKADADYEIEDISYKYTQLKYVARELLSQAQEKMSEANYEDKNDCCEENPADEAVQE